MTRELVNTDTLIVGAGPAGLAVAACLRQKDLPFILLEKSDKIGSSWHNHYDRLHLHTDKKHSELPDLSYPDSYPTFPSREQFIGYLEQYAAHFDLNPRFNREVVSAGLENGRWVSRTNGETYTSENLVITTGYCRQPVMPHWPGLDTYAGQTLHSTDYDIGSHFRGKKVLVVGFGNSGGEIAIDLVEHGAAVALSVRSPVNIIPRDLFGMPLLAVAILMSKLPYKLADFLTAPLQWLLFGNLNRLGLKKMKEGPLEQIYKKQRIPLIDVGTVDLIRKGQIDVCPAINRFENETVHFTDGSTERFDAVVLATGFRPALESYLDEDFLSDRQKAEQHGLYFCGFFVSPTGVLREIAMEAKAIAAKIEQNTN
jgi:cation diffusion facilitator CzcD-associated flavoprotein CzcO